MIYQHETRGRSAKALLVVAAVWGGVALLWITLSIAWWIAALILLMTLPAIWDALRDRRATLEIWPGRVVWASALRQGDRADLDHIRLSRRFDGSLKITLIHPGGAHTRLPPDITPTLADLEQALTAAGIATQRHPFSPF